jgi:hypothetical protein
MVGRTKAELLLEPLGSALVDVEAAATVGPDGNALNGVRHIQRADGSTVWLRLVSQYAEERFGIARHTIVVAEVRPAATWRLS